MKLSNRLNLPLPLVRAIENDSYDAGDSDYTATSLLKPPRIAQLMRGHGSELTEDAADRIWALFGQVVHGIIERAGDSELVEKRLFMEIGGKKISGQIDLWQGNTLWDWKTTSVYSGKDGAKKEWIQQGNINRLLCRENGIEVNKIQYVALYRDWSKMKQERSKEDYPESQVEIFNLPIWPLKVTEAFIQGRIDAHEAAKEKLPLCSEEDRWAKPEKWALMKKGQKRAVKLYDTEEQAVSAAGQVRAAAPLGKGSQFSVEHRPGESTRCEWYCPVSGYCQQFRDMMEEKHGK